MRKPTYTDKLATYISQHKKKCKYCGYPVFIAENFVQNKVLCKVCKHYIYKNDVDEFKDKLKLQIRKGEQNDQSKIE